MSFVRTVSIPALLAFGFLAAEPARAQQPDTNRPGEKVSTKSLSSADRNFLQKAIADGQKEIHAGMAAQAKATAPAVKEFADKMVREHQKANDELRQLARQKGVTVADDRASNGTAKAAKDMPRGSGEAFDRAYMKQQVAAHQKAVSEYEKQSKSGGDEEIRELASKMLPTLKEHLEEARSIASNLGVSTGVSNGAAGKSKTTPADRRDPNKKP